MTENVVVVVVVVVVITAGEIKNIIYEHVLYILTDINIINFFVSLSSLSPLEC